MFAYQKAINDYIRSNLDFPTVENIRSTITADESTPVSIEDMNFLEKAQDIVSQNESNQMLLECFLTYRDNFSEIEQEYTQTPELISQPRKGEW